MVTGQVSEGREGRMEWGRVGREGGRKSVGSEEGRKGEGGDKEGREGRGEKGGREELTGIIGVLYIRPRYPFLFVLVLLLLKQVPIKLIV
jgi:hypothetical protein